MPIRRLKYENVKKIRHILQRSTQNKFISIYPIHLKISIYNFLFQFLSASHSFKATSDLRDVYLVSK